MSPNMHNGEFYRGASMGRRIKKTAYAYEANTYNQTTNTLFVYNGWNLVEEIITEAGEPAGQTGEPTQTSQTREKYYIWGQDLSQSLQGAGGVGGLIATIDENNIYYYCYDTNGNVGQVVSADDGVIAGSYQYDPFGNIVKKTSSGDLSNNFTFSTKYFDEETGLSYYGYRYYSAELGRWLSRDPIGELGSINLRTQKVKNENNLHLYGFIKNNTINLIDPFGLSEYIVLWGIESITDPFSKSGVIGGAKVEGVVISLVSDEKCQFPAMNFDGKFVGVSFPVPYSILSYVGIFKDSWGASDYDFYRIEGDSIFQSAFSLQFGKYGISGPTFVKFGELIKVKMTTTSGFEISAGSHWKGSINLEGLKKGQGISTYDKKFVDSIIEKYNLE